MYAWEHEIKLTTKRITSGIRIIIEKPKEMIGYNIIIIVEYILIILYDNSLLNS